LSLAVANTYSGNWESKDEVSTYYCLALSTNLRN
jgi:hypothetical protein